MTEKTIGGILHRIQKELKAPKANKNTFGNYSYRSAEDILEAVKRCLQEGESIRLIDDVVMIGERYYVKATAILQYSEHGTTEVSTAFAREEETKKGMDAAQITGSASSYARKYALNGLFAIDDTKDADTMDNSKPEEKFTPEQRSLQAEVITKIAMCKDQISLDSVWDEFKNSAESLPQEMVDMVAEQYENREKQIKDGITPQVVSHKYSGVDDAINWMKRMSPVVAGFKSLQTMDAWEANNRPFLAGLDCLKAEKYKKDGKTPKERMLDALAAKRNELTPVG